MSNTADKINMAKKPEGSTKIAPFMTYYNRE